MGACSNGVKPPRESFDLLQQPQTPELKQQPTVNLKEFQTKKYMKYDQERFQAEPFWVCFEKISKRIVPLKQVNYLVTIRLGIAECEITQLYENNNDQILDIEYMFSINPSAAFCSMDVQMGDKMIHGVIKEKEIAKQEFNEGVKQGKTMAYAEENEQFPDIMKVKLGNLAPKSQLKIIFKYVEPLLVCLNKFWRLDISSVIRERYRLKEEQENSVVAKYLQNLIEFNSYVPNHKQEIQVIFEEELNFCQSPTHKIVEKQENQKKIIQLAQSELLNLKSFVLLFSTNKINEPQVCLTQQDNDALTHQKYCATITFIPKLNPQPLDDAYRCFMDQIDLAKQDFPYTDTQSEYIFLLDRSGSMEGLNIEKAREALILFMRSLPLNCYFNIVSFGSNFELMWEKAQQYSQKSIDEAITKVSRMEGDMGGTELLNPLKAIYKGFNNEDCRQFNLFILTDGEVTPNPIIDLIIQKSQPNIRVYSLGIGSSCSKFLIEKSTFVGNGKHQFILDKEDLNDKVIDLLEDSITPYLSKIELATNVNYDTIVPNPQSIISLKKNNRFTVQVLFGEEKETNFEFTVKCLESITGTQWGLNCRIDKKNVFKTTAFHKLAAHKEIKCLENAIRFEEKQVSALLTVKPEFKLEDLIAISTQYQVLCKDTAFICEGDVLSDELKNQMQNKIQIQFQQEKIYHIPDQYSRGSQDDNDEEDLKCQYYSAMPIESCLDNEQYDDMAIENCLEQQYNCYTNAKEIEAPQCSQMVECQVEDEEIEELENDDEEIEKLENDEDDDNEEIEENQQQSQEKEQFEEPQKKIKLNSLSSFQDIIIFAQVDGSFKYNDDLWEQMKLAQVQKQIGDDLIWVTILSLCCLEILYKAQQNLWNLIYKKSIAYLGHNGIDYHNLKQQIIGLIQEARKQQYLLNQLLYYIILYFIIPKVVKLFHYQQLQEAGIRLESCTTFFFIRKSLINLNGVIIYIFIEYLCKLFQLFFYFLMYFGKFHQMNQMPQNVQITPVQCNKSNHQNEIIRMLCLSAQCQENSAFCFLCSVKGHLKCREESILAQDIPKLLTDIQELKLDMVALAQKFNQQFKSALSRIEELDMQISQYRETPNLTNLNQIGKMLRTFNQEQFVNNIVVSLNKLQTGFERKHNKYQGNFSPKNYIKPLYPKYSCHDP